MAFVFWLLLPSRWLLAQALPGANRLIKHLHSKKVPFALASNSITENVEAKVSHQPGYSFIILSFLLVIVDSLRMYACVGTIRSPFTFVNLLLFDFIHAAYVNELIHANISKTCVYMVCTYTLPKFSSLEGSLVFRPMQTHFCNDVTNCCL